LFKFIYYNFVCSCIIRDKGCYLIPYKNSVIDLDRSSRINLKNGNILLGSSKLRGSKAEACLRMGENARWVSKGKAELFSNTLIDIKKNSIFETGYFSANCGTVIVCAKKITLGENVMLGRNIMLYDSDHHQIIDRNGYMINYDSEITINDNVWLTSNVTVLRGVTIGEGSIVTAQTVIKKDLPPYSLASGNATLEITPISRVMSWSRESTYMK
jgi:acetyltransferase-like isoleucine patch superfamily enzyme